MDDLDREIRDVLDVFGLLLVFVAALLSFSMTRAADLLERQTPTVRADRDELRGKVSGARALSIVLLIMIACVLAVAATTLWRALATVAPGRPLSPLRAGFAVLNVFLLLAGGWVARTLQQLNRNAKDLQS